MLFYLIFDFHKILMSSFQLISSERSPTLILPTPSSPTYNFTYLTSLLTYETRLPVRPPHKFANLVCLPPKHNTDPGPS